MTKPKGLEGEVGVSEHRGSAVEESGGEGTGMSEMAENLSLSPEGWHH